MAEPNTDHTLDAWIDAARADSFKNSMNYFAGDGVRLDFDINFSGGYISKADIKVYQVNPVTGARFEVEIVSVNNNTVRVDRVTPVGRNLVIYRDTDKRAPLVDFSDNSIVNERNLDLNAKQAIFSVAEMVDRFDDSVTFAAEAAGAVELAREARDQSIAAKVEAQAARDAALLSATQAGASSETAVSAASQAAADATTAESASTTAVGASTAAELAKTQAQAAQVATQQIVDQAQDTLDQIAEVNALVDDVKGARLPVGCMIPFPAKGNYPGYLYMDGSQFDTATYTQLAVIYPDGVLPDMRSTSVTGVDDGRGKFAEKTANTFLNSSNAAHSHQTSASTVPAHAHSGATLGNGNHTHNRGDMEISGAFAVDWGRPGVHATGALRAVPVAGGTIGGNTMAGGNGFDFYASRSWTGHTSWSGEHVHHINADGEHSHTITVHPDGGAEARPYSYTVFWYIKAVDAVGQPEVIEAQTLVARVAALEANATPAGTIIHVAGSTVVPGWLKANGAVVSRTQYSRLFAAIGTTYGAGDGSTTFGLPDLRGEFVRGLDDGREVDTARQLGSVQGFATQNHNHFVDQYGSVLIHKGSTLAGEGSASYAVIGTPNYTGSRTSTINAIDGGVYDNETRPRNIALVALIKT